MEQEKLSYGQSRNNNMVECDDIYYLFIGEAYYSIDDSHYSTACFNTIHCQKSYFGEDLNCNKDEEFVGIAKKDEEVALVQVWYDGKTYDPMRVSPEDARDASVRNEWLEDVIDTLKWMKDEGLTDWNGLDPETVNPNEIQVHTMVYKIGKRCECIEEYWT